MYYAYFDSDDVIVISRYEPITKQAYEDCIAIFISYEEAAKWAHHRSETIVWQ